MSDAVNRAQAEYWNAAQTWIDEQREHDEMLEPFGLLAIDALAPRAGERILDVGCGTGATTLAIADAVGPGGAVVGADVSALLLGAARERGGRGNLSFIEADAQIYPFEPASFDGAFSRFGVMFFDDTTAAFRNVARALRPAGRFAFVCWQGFEAQEWQRVPAEAAGIERGANDDGPGPFRFADRNVLREHLERAGFVRIDISGVERPIVVGGGSAPGAAARLIMRSRLGLAIAGQGDEAVRRVEAALEARRTPRGVEMGCAVWVVRAARAA
jgi:SAM-dependent methyltransferase